MLTTGKKRFLLFLALMVLVALVGAAVFGFQLTRQFHLDSEDPNAVEAAEARRKIRLFNNSLNHSQRGFVRLSQLEINSYLLSVLTNKPESGSLRLLRVGVELSETNFIFHSWTEARVLNMPIPLVLRRVGRITHHATNRWNLPMISLHVGDVRVPGRFTRFIGPAFSPLDQWMVPEFSWMTNVPFMAIAKNEINQSPELRLYTYWPGRAE